MRESTLLSIGAFALFDARTQEYSMKKLAWPFGMHEKTLVALGAKAVQVELAYFDFFRIELNIMRERALVTFLATTLDKKVTQNFLFYLLRFLHLLLRLFGLSLLHVLVYLHVFALFVKFLFQRVHRDHVRVVVVVGGVGMMMITMTSKLIGFIVFFFGDDRIDKVRLRAE